MSQTVQQQHRGLAQQTRAMLLYDANRESAMMLWFFLGPLGGHNFHLKRTGVAVAQLILSVTMVGIVITLSGSLLMRSSFPVGCRQNNLLAVQLGA